MPDNTPPAAGCLVGIAALAWVLLGAVAALGTGYLVFQGVAGMFGESAPGSAGVGTLLAGTAALIDGVLMFWFVDAMGKRVFGESPNDMFAPLFNLPW